MWISLFVSKMSPMVEFYLMKMKMQFFDRFDIISWKFNWKKMENNDFSKAKKKLKIWR